MKTNRLAADLFAAATSLLMAVALIVLATAGAAQQSPKSPSPQTDDQGNMPGMDMGDMQHETDQNPQVARAANDEMSGPEMEMGPHMFMTDLQPTKPGDDQRAQEIVDIVGKSIRKYKDYRAALTDGYRIFLPNVPQKQYHFTNYRNAFAAQFTFNPAHPTSLLYRKTADGYELVGAMFTAPKKASDQQLDERVPLSVARWHRHVNFCMPPKGTTPQQTDWKKFGPGSIATEDACAQAGGRWIPQLFGWMVHVYPFEADPGKVWPH